eukprot:scaffold71234_cov82-Cyclotella_meneghiniana.AAC.2
MKSPIPSNSKSQLEQSNGFRNIRVNVSGCQIGRAIESVVIGSLQRPMIVFDDKLEEAHSIELSKIFEEAETIFKAICQKLNNLTLEHTRPKTELSSADMSKETTTISEDHNPNYVEQVGKAGKSNLHGLTSDEAIDRLNKALIGWVDTAMKGEYPGVIPVDVVCGGGNQILSETVKTWIKSIVRRML